jgi:hypothetical protein
LDLSQAQLAVEQDNLLKAVSLSLSLLCANTDPSVICLQARFIERLKRRGREYVDVQRKSNTLLVTTSALCTATNASTTHNKTKRSTKGPSSTSTMAGEDRGSHSDYADYREDAPHSATSHRRERGAEGELPLAPHMYPASALKQGSSYGGSSGGGQQGGWR